MEISDAVKKADKRKKLPHHNIWVGKSGVPVGLMVPPYFHPGDSHAGLITGSE